MQVAAPASEAAFREMVTTKGEGHFQVCGLLVHLKGALAEPKLLSMVAGKTVERRQLKRRDLHPIRTGETRI
jgi:hypothetical protein